MSIFDPRDPKGFGFIVFLASIFFGCIVSDSEPAVGLLIVFTGRFFYWMMETPE